MQFCLVLGLCMHIWLYYCFLGDGFLHVITSILNYEGPILNLEYNTKKNLNELTLGDS